MRRFFASKAFGIAMRLFILVGLIGSLYPWYTDMMHSLQSEATISHVESVYSDMSDPDRLENVTQARAYNDRLAGALFNEPEGGIWDYRTQLTYKGTPESMMAWVDIPKIDTRLPIFHYATNEVLSTGVGHLEWSALPVGGVGTRCVLSAHSGMQDTRMFDDIRELQKGDTFTVWTLSEPYCYRVCDIDVVLPDDLSILKPDPDRDLCTLVTCTPYGVNTHRLLVTGERCEYVESEENKPTEGAAPYLNKRTIPFMIVSGMLFLFFVALTVSLFRRKSRKRERA